MECKENSGITFPSSERLPKLDSYKIFECLPQSKKVEESRKISAPQTRSPSTILNNGMEHEKKTLFRVKQKKKVSFECH